MHTHEPLVSFIVVFLYKTQKHKNIQKIQKEGEWECSLSLIILKVKVTSMCHGRLWTQYNPCWVGWVLTFGYRNWTIILGVTPPASSSSSHYGELLLGLDEVTCLSASCHAVRSKQVSPCVSHFSHVLTYCVSLPIYVKVLDGSIRSSTLVDLFRVEWWMMPECLPFDESSLIDANSLSKRMT